ncbi:putative major capsid protein [Serratia phage vB_SmaS_PhooPhighters]|uniref:Putative major capsid protein n=1 Tax=Serratia phage vB_SmaS_Rovert TaxID=2777363 RepID=A0A7T3N9R8_9CAUD|nr:putative major capsid protein [Serratia phage vB_SmaS_Rovert]QPX74973.1 putative major capsid protein [Serratia phage vB_SmaS_Rovert]UGO51946.1 putative major capsid protein [Serratia phage vB_SmaS_PhooPhighters]
MTLKEMYAALKEKRASAVKINSEMRGKQPTDEQRAAWEALQSEIEILSADILREEEIRSTDAVLADQINETAPAKTTDQETRRNKALNAYLRSGFSDMPEEHRAALKELRAMNTTSNADGGYTIDTQTLARVQESEYSYGGILAATQPLPTSKGNPINWPVSLEGAAKGVIVGEEQNHGKKSTQFGQHELKAYKISSQIILVSLELLTDSEIDIAAYVTRIARTRVDRGIASYIVNGTGTNQPSGILLQIDAAKRKSVALADFTFEALVDALHSVDPAYRSRPGFGFAMHDQTLAVMRKWKDEQGNPIYVRSLATDRPDTFMGYPLIIDNELPILAAGAKGAVVVGDFKSILVRRVGSMIIRRLDELYAETDQVGFLAFERFDCVLDDKQAIAAIDIAAAAGGGGTAFKSAETEQESAQTDDNAGGMIGGGADNVPAME